MISIEMKIKRRNKKKFIKTVYCRFYAVINEVVFRKLDVTQKNGFSSGRGILSTSAYICGYLARHTF